MIKIEGLVILMDVVDYVSSPMWDSRDRNLNEPWQTCYDNAIEDFEVSFVFDRAEDLTMFLLKYATWIRDQNDNYDFVRIAR